MPAAQKGGGPPPASVDRLLGGCAQTTPPREAPQARLLSPGTLQRQLDVHEVVRGPRARVLERQKIPISIAQGLDGGVELALARPPHQEGSAEDHVVADELVRPGRDGERVADGVDARDQLTR